MTSLHTRITASLAAVSALVLALAPAPAGAATPSPTPGAATRPSIMKQAGDALLQPAPKAASTAPAAIQPRATVGGTISREVFGFAQAGAIFSSSAGYTTWNFNLLSTVAYFGIHVNAADGSLITNDTGWNTWNDSRMAGLINAAHSAGTRVVLTIVYQSTGGDMCSALQHAGTTVQQTVDQVVAKHADGVNIDYEGSGSTCPSSNGLLTSFVQQMRNRLGAASHLTVDTYASSAAYSGGGNFYDLQAMAPYVTAFFVMAYEMGSDTNMTPTSPYSNGNYYGWNDVRVASGYAQLVGGGKTILGLPYYGWAACVNSLAENGTVSGHPQWVANTELGIDGLTTIGSPHTDSHDGVDVWYAYNSSTYNCQRELYIDSAGSLSAKYQLVGQYGLLGAGIWSLDMGGGLPALWNAIQSNFGYPCPLSISVGGTQNTTQFPVTVAASGCQSQPTIYLSLQDNTTGAPALTVGSARPPGSGGNYSATFAVDSYAGHSYSITAGAQNGAGYWAIPPAPVAVGVAANAAQSHLFKGLYTLDGYGGVHNDDSQPEIAAATWPGWDIARAVRAIPGAASPSTGAVLDGFGGLHGYGSPLPTYNISAYWPGFDIARDIQFLPDGSGGYVLDGFGGLHPFAVSGHAMPLAANLSAYWPGWDIAHKFVILPSGQGGYVLDGWGGIHPFAIGSNAFPAAASLGAYWPGWDIARDIQLMPGSNAGYVLDGWGGVHPFNGARQVNPPAYWPGWDIARRMVLITCASPPCGYTMDGWGGLHPLNAPPVGQFTYWPGWSIARDITGS